MNEYPFFVMNSLFLKDYFLQLSMNLPKSKIAIIIISKLRLTDNKIWLRVLHEIGKKEK